MIRRAILILGLALMLAGCQTPDRTNWNQANVHTLLKIYAVDKAWVDLWR